MIQNIFETPEFIPATEGGPGDEQHFMALSESPEYRAWRVDASGTLWFRRSDCFTTEEGATDEL